MKTQTPISDRETFFVGPNPDEVFEVVPLRVARDLETKLSRFQAAFEAAQKYIESSVCDPDTTAEMWVAYLAYKQNKGLVEELNLQ